MERYRGAEAGPPPAPETHLSPAVMLERARKLDAWVRRNIKQSGGIDEQADLRQVRRGDANGIACRVADDHRWLVGRSAIAWRDVIAHGLQRARRA